MMRSWPYRRRPTFLALTLLCLGLVTAPTASAEAPRAGRTIEKVWYSTDRKGAPGKRFNLNGDLTLGDDALEIATRKRNVRIALDTIHVISFGKMRGDVDTDWVVLSVGAKPPRALVGLRDGRRFGYGQRTAEIHEAVRETVRRAGAAQYGVPEGFATYDAIDDQVTFAVPEGWTPHLDSLIFVGKRAPWGKIIFSSVPPAHDAETAEVASGEVPAFFVERREAGRGMGCKGFSEAAREALVAEAIGDAMFGEGAEIVQTRHPEPLSVDGCAGLRIEARGPRADGVDALFDLRAVSHGDTLFLFGLRTRMDRYEAHAAPFEAAMDSIRFAVAR